MDRDETDIEPLPEAAPAPRARFLHAVPSVPGVPSAPGRRRDAAPGARAASRAMEPDEVARVTLETLRQRHRDLDAAIEALQAQGSDPLTVRRLKKRKLALRDRIAAIEDRLTPDIIA